MHRPHTRRPEPASVAMLLATMLSFPRVAVAQQTATPTVTRVAGGAHATTAAAFAAAAPAIDGLDDDAVWRTAPAIRSFREYQPVEDRVPQFRTSVRIAYDPGNLYVFLRAFDAHPDSIVTMLARRDVWTAADMMGVLIDPYHDRRTGYELDVNPSGVKTDWSIRNDGDEDGAWDAVWDVATRVDSLGWTAEFRIPLSQLGYRSSASDTFGIAVWRQVERAGERMIWPARYTSRPGIVSQFADLTGLERLAAPRRAQLVPYVLTKNVAVPDGAGRRQRATVGGDLTYALLPGLRLDATVNPDFGQVEADPAELNLTAFETFFPEHRPFFVANAEQFSASLNCGLYACYHESLFYSRRIGRGPQLRAVNGDAASPTATRIRGAAKLTARVGGLAVGALGSGTQRVSGPTGLTIEPAARYGVFRATENLRRGESGIGIMATTVDRSLDPSSAPYLHRNASAAGLDFRHRFLSQYVISGSADWSRITGSRAAITLTQRDPIHNYQRADGALVLDTTRTSLSGDDEQMAFDKLGGVVQFEGIYTRRSPGFEVNDIGYLRQADQQTAYGWFGLVFNRPTRLYRALTGNLNAWWWATTAGLVTNRGVNANVHWTLSNLWMVGAWVSFDNLGATFCDRCARGGPALRTDRMTSTWFNVRGDDRHHLVPQLTLRTSRTDGGRSTSFSVSSDVTANVSSRLSASLGTQIAAVHDRTQWLGNYADSTGETHYAFALLDQRTLGVTARLDYTLSTTLSLQAYAQPFASWGRYDDVREIADPRAVAYVDRFRAYDIPGGAAAGVDSKQLNADVVLRWEYHPGSTLFLVWTQGRQAVADDPGTGGAWDHVRGIFDLRADNTFLLKISYWFTP